MRSRPFPNEDEELVLSDSTGFDPETGGRSARKSYPQGHSGADGRCSKCCATHITNILVGCTLLLFLVMVAIIFYHYTLLTRHEQQIINQGIKLYRTNETLHKLHNTFRKMENDKMVEEKKVYRENHQEAQQRRVEMEKLKREIEKKDEENSQDRKAYLHEMR